MTSEKVKFEWDPEKEKNYEFIRKDGLIILPRFESTIQIYTDSLEYKLDSLVSQIDDNNNPLPVYFHSRKFNGPQIRFTVVNKEALEVISTLNHLRNCYLLANRSFKLIP